MKITRFWARGFRSLNDVTLDPLGDFNVFYGPNGSGKSNILAAMEVLFRLLPIAAGTGTFESDTVELSNDEVAKRAGVLAMAVLRPEDFFAQRTTFDLVLGAEILFDAAEVVAPPGIGVERRSVEIEVRFTRFRDAELRLTRFRAGPQSVDMSDAQVRESPIANDLLRWLCETLPARAFAVLDAVRAMPLEKERTAVDDTVSDVVLAELRSGRLKSALFEAKNAPGGPYRARYEAMQGLLSRCFGRPRFDVVRDPRTREIELREMLGAPNPDDADVPVNLAGLGMVQIYSIVASILFARTRAVGVEEPEAHLHAPTAGRQLRALLRDLVQGTEGQRPYIDQLFIATHSNLFDLDPTGYWDVSMVDGETRVLRKPLHEIDAKHLYEPGPAKHALQEVLRLYGDEFVFRTQDGRRLRAQEMLYALQRDDSLALEFLEGLHDAAVQVVGLNAQEDQDQPPEASR